MRFEGKTVDDATAQACIKLEKIAKELDIKVIQEPTKGFLGIGSKPAIIEVEIKKEQKKLEKDRKKTEIIDVLEKNIINEKEKTEEKIEKISEEKIEEDIVVEEKAKFSITEEVLEFLDGYFEKIGIKSSYNIDVDESNRDVNINIITDKPTLVIGKRGALLDALQVIVNNVFSKNRGGYWIKFNCDEYREKRYKTIESLAIRTAKNVKKYRKKMYLENLNSSERKIIHSILQRDDFIETYSEGKEPNRRLVIALKK